MSDGSSREITPEQEARFLEWLGEKVQHGCAVCGGASWSTARELYAPLVYDATTQGYVGGVGVPCAMANCADCGYVMLFNAVQIGLIRAAE